MYGVSVVKRAFVTHSSGMCSRPKYVALAETRTDIRRQKKNYQRNYYLNNFFYFGFGTRQLGRQLEDIIPKMRFISAALMSSENQ